MRTRAVLALVMLLSASCVSGAGSRGNAEYRTLRGELRGACAPLVAKDFRGGFLMDGATPYREFLDALIREHGASRGLGRSDVRLFTSSTNEPTHPAFPGILAGELVCNPGILIGDLGRYRIVLYEKALVGRSVSCLYNTIAHEFKHVLQDADSGGRLQCGQIPGPSQIEKYERSADRWADEIVPACRCG